MARTPLLTLLTTQFEAKSPNNQSSVLFAINQSTPGTPLTIITSTVAVGAGSIGISLGFPFEPGVTATPFTFEMGQTSDQFNIVVTQAMPDATWSSIVLFPLVPGSITVTSATIKRIKGTFQFTLPPASAKQPAAGDLEVQQADFDIGITKF